MNIFRKYTRKMLRKNKTRTLVTIIGIVLSMALFTAVIEGAYSGQRYMIDAEIARTGAYHGYYSDLNEEETADFTSQDKITEYATWDEVGWAESGSKNEYKPYLYIQSVSDNIEDLISIRLTEGRMPENDHEIVIPAHLLSDGGVTYSVGDEIRLEVGDRVSDDNVHLTERNSFTKGERLINTSEKMYTVVGICERLSSSVEGYSCPGYTAFTAGGGKGSLHVFFKVSNISDYYNIMNEVRTPGKGRVAEAHDDLIRLSGTFRNDLIQRTLYGFAGVLIALIVFGSISLIYNSFSISLSDRTRQFGILKSIGATRKQIGSSVLYEALLLAGISIPIGMVVGCLGMGITFRLLGENFARLINIETTARIHIVLNAPALIIAAVICLLTTLLAAWIPARRANKIPAIEAIRQSEDVKIRPREVRTSALTTKLFGFEGMMASKNFKRNKKRYRSTIISLFVSITLFIAASSFCDYLTGAVRGVSS
ncbi:MAG: FtsX-like permease family protein, partial [Lachnospiraceae bacterium]|nr:FtsX-like permease family protein [Lachnospiraceae bacterium]